MIFAKFNEEYVYKNKYFISDTLCSLHLRTILKNGYI